MECNRRVVITGMGVVSSLGCTIDTFWASLVAGESGIRKIEDEKNGQYATKIAASIPDYSAERVGKRKETKYWDRSILFAVDATLQALQSADIQIRENTCSRTGVYIGSGIGGIDTLSRACEKMYGQRKARTSPYLIPMMIPNMASGIVSMEINAAGPSASIVSACATANSAIGEAYYAILNDRADVMVAGGAEAPITPLAMAGFCSMKAMSTRNATPQNACAPFDLNRDGFVMGEGAGILILESLEHAHNRGAPILAELKGFGSASDAYHLTAPDPEGAGAFRAMSQAMKMAGWDAADVNYINAHATGTSLGDLAETIAIKNVFRDQPPPPVSSTKSATGHLFGAAGGIEAITVIQAINTSTIPPTLNLNTPDPECDLDYVPLISREHRVEKALSNGFGFGGHNSVLAIGRFSHY